MGNLRSGIAVVEGKWWKHINISVQSFFELISDIHYDNPHAYYYEMFCDASALRSVVGRVSKMRGVRYVYVATHGTDNGIYGSDGVLISRAQLKNILLAATALDGLFMGSCWFTDADNADFLLNPPNNNGARPPMTWIAGYTTPADWIDSSAMDMYFWNRFLKFSDRPPRRRIEDTAHVIRKVAPGLVKRLGMRIFVRRMGGGGLVNLLEDV